MSTFKKIIIHNPHYGSKHCGPLDQTDLIEVKDLISRVKQIQKEKPYIFNNRTIIQGIREGNSEDKTYKIGFYNFAISKGRMELQHIIKRFPPDTDVDKIVDKWGDIMGYLFWRGKVCDYEFSIWTEPKITASLPAPPTDNSDAPISDTTETRVTDANNTSDENVPVIEDAKDEDVKYKDVKNI